MSWRAWAWKIRIAIPDAIFAQKISKKLQKGGSEVCTHRLNRLLEDKND
jgi:hypothetical protein